MFIVNQWAITFFLLQVLWSEQLTSWSKNRALEVFISKFHQELKSDNWQHLDDKKHESIEHRLPVISGGTSAASHWRFVSFGWPIALGGYRVASITISVGVLSVEDTNGTHQSSQTAWMGEGVSMDNLSEFGGLCPSSRGEWEWVYAAVIH